MNILFRTSGGSAPGKELGTGHIFRCINLSQQFKEHKIFFLIEDYGGIKKIFKEKNFSNVEFLKSNISIKEDYQKTLKTIEKKKIDLVIVDKIYTPKMYLQKLKKEIFTVYICDQFEYEYPASMIINGFVGLKNEIKSNKYHSKCLLGPSFQILSKKYEKKLKVKKNNDILITFGGYDANNLIEKLCVILPNFLKNLKIKIILGPVTKKSDCLKKIEKTFQQKLQIIRYTDDLRKEILQSKIGLCSGGITTYEFASLKVPFGIISQYKHQEITALQWKKHGFGKDLGKNDKKLLYRIENFMENFQNEKINFKMKNKLVDGKGSKRVKNEILKSFKEYNKKYY